MANTAQKDPEGSVIRLHSKPPEPQAAWAEAGIHMKDATLPL